ncbi:hypothetical protein GOV11_00445 [Candidatus Woesearchaeota archaeon]|nr:hypothetical protein [Candidatus Woesearchaeota archaeon]
MELGGNIILDGFSERDFTELIVVKKMVGQYARKMSDMTHAVDQLKVVLKEPGKGPVEIHTACVIDKKDYTSKASAHNIYIALDDSLKKVFTQVQKAHDKAS